jgi:uncharacterized protein (TIGR03067 family)
MWVNPWFVTRVSDTYGNKESKDLDDVWTITKTHFIYPSGKKEAYTINPRKNPREIDTEGKRRLIGIYQLKGDELKISITDSDTARPKKCEKGSDHNFFILKRIKEKRAPSGR